MTSPPEWYWDLIAKWPDLVITLIGVFFGVFFAYWTKSARAHRQEVRARRAEELRDKHHLQAYLERTKRELRENEQTVKQILEKLDRSKHARVDLFMWVAALGKALSVVAYDDLSRSGLQRLLSDNLQIDLFDARQRILGFKSMLEAAEPAAAFYFGYGGGQSEADLVLHNLRTYGSTTHDGLVRIKQAAFEEAERLGTLAGR